ncbi:hypothetical protein D3C73_1362870 [compost metagenome]
MITTRRAWVRATAGEAAAAAAWGRAEEAVTSPPYRKIIVPAKLLARIIRRDGRDARFK